jgi:hypothetical protein
MVPEDNTLMQNSYLLLDERIPSLLLQLLLLVLPLKDMCFLNCTSGAKIPSKSILAVGVDVCLLLILFHSTFFDFRAVESYNIQEALAEAGFNTTEFETRGGLYPDQWTREQSSVGSESDCNTCSGGGTCLYYYYYLFKC